MSTRYPLFSSLQLLSLLVLLPHVHSRKRQNMHGSYLLAVLGAIAALCTKPVAAQGDNLVKNGAFDSGLGDWGGLQTDFASDMDEDGSATSGSARSVQNRDQPSILSQQVQPLNPAACYVSHRIPPAIMLRAPGDSEAPD